MLGKAVFLLLLTVTFLPRTAGEALLHFAPGASACTGGGADDAHLHPPGVITCAREKSRWTCVSTRVHDAFFRIHHARVTCVDEACTLEYRLDYTPLAVFAIAAGATLLAGLVLAVAMYLAVVRMAGRYGDGEERERFVDVGMRRPGYGSFGGKMYCLGHFSDSLQSLLEFDVEDGLQGEGEEREEREEEREEEEMRVEWVERETYLG